MYIDEQVWEPFHLSGIELLQSIKDLSVRRVRNHHHLLAPMNVTRAATCNLPRYTPDQYFCHSVSSLKANIQYHNRILFILGELQRNMTGILPHDMIKDIMKELKKHLQGKNLGQSVLTVERKYEIAKCIHSTLHTCTSIQYRDLLKATELSTSLEQVQQRNASTLLMEDLNTGFLQAWDMEVRLQGSDITEAVRLASQQEYYQWENIQDEYGNIVVQADDSYEYTICAKDGMEESANFSERHNSTAPEQTERMYSKLSLADRIEGTMETWIPSMTDESTCTNFPHLREKPCRVSHIYQCTGCAYLANNRYDLLAHCASAVVGTYNGFLAHEEIPLDRLATAYVRTEVGYVDKAYDPTNVVNFEKIQEAICIGDRMKQQDMYTSAFDNGRVGSYLCSIGIISQNYGTMECKQHHITKWTS